MSIKTVDLGELRRQIVEGPVGEEKIRKLTEAAQTLAEALSLTAKRQRPYEVPVSSTENTIRFGLIGDTHIGSLYQRLDALRAFYDHCKRDGIEYVLHAGDVLDGWKVYKGQEFELHPNGRSWNEQKAMFAESVPDVGITTIFITGNHDASFKKLVGLAVGEELATARPDWKFIGQDIGEVTLKTKGGQGFRVMLLHPGGGTPYALSYSLQKIIEAIAGGQKPDLIAAGHFHKAIFMPTYRNIRGYLTGCFQSQTPFMVQQKMSAAHVGGWVIEVTLGERKKLTSRIREEFIGFYEPEK